MAAAELRPEVEQAVARVDLAPTIGRTGRSRSLTPGSHETATRKPACGDDPLLALAEEPGRIGERTHYAAEVVLELPLGARDLLLGGRVVERWEVGVRERVRLEAERPLAVEVDDLVPAEHRRLRAVPPEGRPPVDDRRRDEDGRPKAALGQQRLRLLGHVDEPVVEAEADRPAARNSLVDQLRGLDDVDDAVGLGGEIVHLPPKVARADGELVAVVGDPVVEEDPQAAPSSCPSVRAAHAVERALVASALRTYFTSASQSIRRAGARPSK